MIKLLQTHPLQHDDALLNALVARGPSDTSPMPETRIRSRSRRRVKWLAMCLSEEDVAW